MSRGLPNDVRTQLEKATDSAMLSVKVYNKPATKFRSGGFIVLICIAWASVFLDSFRWNSLQCLGNQHWNS